MPKFIINADDYGMSKDVNKAIIDSFSKGLISDTSMMAACEDGFDDACNDSYREMLKNTVGVHLCITYGKPLTDAMRDNAYFCKGGTLISLFQGRRV